MYEPKKFEDLIGLEGFSEKMLRNHFTLYEGYVNNFNKDLDLLKELDRQGKASSAEFSETKRRLGWEFDGMRLHEYYFENMMKGGSGIDADSDLASKIEKDFGSLENWGKNFKATGAMRGIGWVMLCYDSIGDKLFNIWINEHDGGHFVGAIPILVMDVFEHAYMTDYEIKRAEYIDAFFKSICWHVAQTRFQMTRA